MCCEYSDVQHSTKPDRKVCQLVGTQTNVVSHQL